MLTLRPASARGGGSFGWLDTRHTFSFGDYQDPRHMGFRSLRVINDDRIAAGGGFPTHPHREMEILTCVLNGELEHKDSLGTGSVIRPGEWQAMTAGTGIRHSEFNPSATTSVHLLQIWLHSDRAGRTPSYDQKAFPESEKRGQWRVVASPDGRDGSLTIHQDAVLSATVLEPGEAVRYELAAGRGAWLHVATGAVTVNGQRLADGDAVAVEDESTLTVVGEQRAEVLLFDLR